LKTRKKLEGAYFQGGVEKPSKKHQQFKASYYGSISLIDKQVGRLMDYLDETEIRENTIIIFTSDRGEMLGDYGLTYKGCRFYKGTVHVPLIISWKSHFREGHCCGELTSLIDIAPTSAEIYGVKLKRTHGKSMLPLLQGNNTEKRHREYIRCECYNASNMFAPYEPERNVPCYANMFFDGRYKLITYHNLNTGELYNLEPDPDEFNNLWDSKDFLSVKLELMAKSFDASIVCTDPGTPLIGRF
jgi:arylsulfatase A-like enzyme